MDCVQGIHGGDIKNDPNPTSEYRDCSQERIPKESPKQGRSFARTVSEPIRLSIRWTQSLNVLIQTMHLSISTYFAFLLGLGTLATAQVESRSIKCVCDGITDNSQTACVQTGGSFNVTGCGFAGCCVYANNEQTRFIENCRTLGYGFRRCDDCRSC